MFGVDDDSELARFEQQLQQYGDDDNKLPALQPGGTRLDGRVRDPATQLVEPLPQPLQNTTVTVSNHAVNFCLFWGFLNLLYIIFFFFCFSCFLFSCIYFHFIFIFFPFFFSPHFLLLIKARSKNLKK